MYRLLRFTLVCAAALGLMQPGTAAAQSSPDVRGLMNGLIAAGAPGAMAVVEDRGGPTTRVALGVADVRTGQAPAFGQAYHIASQTKPMIATVVLQLVGEGKVRLDDPVERYLPRLLPNGGQITIRQLLTHTSGLAEPLEQVIFDIKDWLPLRNRTFKPRELVAMSVAGGQLFPPGSAWSYSNANYDVLGLVIRKVTHSSVAHQLEQRIFRPLNMRHTSFPFADPDMHEPHFHGYLQLSETEPLVDVTHFNPSWAWAAGAVVSTLDDVDRFWDGLVAGKLLTPALLNEMMTTVPTGFNGYRYGLGIEMYSLPCGTTIFGHTGGYPGYISASFRTLDSSREARAVGTLETSSPRLSQAASAALVGMFCVPSSGQARSAATSTTTIGFR
jgi:D-alanyl-D-alanine carboxypeptidase